MSKQNGSANGSGNGAVDHEDKVRVAIVGVGNCASSFIQGVEYYKDANPSDFVPGLMHVDLGGYHVRDIEFTAAFDIDADKVGQGPLRGDLARSEQHDEVQRRAEPRRPGASRHDARRSRQVPEGEDPEGARRDRRHREHPARDEDRRARLLSARGLRAGDQVVRRAGARRRLRVRELHPRLHRARGLLAEALQEGRPADHRRRHQVAGRRDDRAPDARAAVRRARRAHAAHQPAERRRQHGLLQHARARAAGVQEDLQDQRRHVDPRPRAARRRRLHRPVGLRAVADGPQVGPHPDRGRVVRRRAAEHGAEARGLGLAELGRHRDRRRAAVQARPQQGHRRRARGAELLPDEVTAEAGAGPGRARPDRGVHRRERAREGHRGRRRRARRRRSRASSAVRSSQPAAAAQLRNRAP